MIVSQHVQINDPETEAAEMNSGMASADTYVFFLTTLPYLNILIFFIFSLFSALEKLTEMEKTTRQKSHSPTSRFVKGQKSISV